MRSPSTGSGKPEWMQQSGRCAAALVHLTDDQLQHSPRQSNPAGGRYLLPSHSPGRPPNPLGLADTLSHRRPGRWFHAMTDPHVDSRRQVRGAPGAVGEGPDGVRQECGSNRGGLSSERVHGPLSSGGLSRSAAGSRRSREIGSGQGDTEGADVRAGATGAGRRSHRGTVRPLRRPAVSARRPSGSRVCLPALRRTGIRGAGRRRVRGRWRSRRRVGGWSLAVTCPIVSRHPTKRSAGGGHPVVIT